MACVDFAVVGGGIAGTATAAFLASAGSVIVLEQEEHLGRHSTGRSAAIFIANYGSENIRTLSRRSRIFLDQPPAGFGPLLERRGSLTIASAERTQALHDKVAGRTPETCVHVGREGACRLVPILKPDCVADAFLDPSAADIDVHSLHLAFQRLAKHAGASIHTRAEVLGLRRTDNEWRLQLSGGEMRARVVVNAAGAWADRVAQMAGRAALGLVPHRRTAMLIDPPAGLDVSRWPFVIDVDETLYFKPDAGKLLISPADTTPAVPGDAQPDEWDVAVAVDRFESSTGIDVRRVAARWAGLRTFVADGEPVLGFDADLPDFFWVAGLGGFGIQTAPAIGELAAALIQGAAVPQWAAASALERAFSPARVNAR